MKKNKLTTSAFETPSNEIIRLLDLADNEIVLIAPYIQTNALKIILPHKNKIKITIITSWKLRDLWLGVSDLKLYNYAKDTECKIFINNRIHLKIALIDWDSCIYGSSNYTYKGLGISENYNLELNSDQVKVDNETLLYVRSILRNSILLDDVIYSEYETLLDKLDPLPKIEELEINKLNQEKEFLISSLPMSKNIETLYSIYLNNYSDGSFEEINCAMHDVALYKIPDNLDCDKFKTYLQITFFNHIFIIRLLEFIDSGDRYFGEVKAWIQSNCSDVPVPSRRDLTGNIQVLYKWIVELSNGEYLSDRPNYSQRIYKAT